jgi:hypothetical protein
MPPILRFETENYLSAVLKLIGHEFVLARNITNKKTRFSAAQHQDEPIMRDEFVIKIQRDASLNPDDFQSITK